MKRYKERLKSVIVETTVMVCYPPNIPTMLDCAKQLDISMKQVSTNKCSWIKGQGLHEFWLLVESNPEFYALVGKAGESQRVQVKDSLELYLKAVKSLTEPLVLKNGFYVQYANYNQDWERYCEGKECYIVIDSYEEGKTPQETSMLLADFLLKELYDGASLC